MARYRWGWPHLPDAPEITGTGLGLVVFAVYPVVLAVFAIPVVRDATGVAWPAVAVVCAVHAAWMLVSQQVLHAPARRSKRVFDAVVIGNIVAAAGGAAALPILAGEPGSVLWGALVMYATMNGGVIGFGPSLGVQVLQVGVPLATIPIFLAQGGGGWAVAGPVLAALFAGIGYHLTAFHSLQGTAHRREVEKRLEAAERLAAELRLARDLHDAVGSSLGAVKVYADLLAGSAPTLATPLSDVAQAGLDELRSVLDALAPPHDGGLAGTVSAIAQRLSPAGVAVRVTGSWPAVPAPVRVAVARIVQEAAHNAIRHGKAGAIEVRGELADGVLRVAIADDGHGFDPAAGAIGRGLASMRARTDDLGGALAVASRPGAGATITVSFPVAA